MTVDLAAVRARVDAATPGPWVATASYPHLALQPGDDSIISFNLTANPAADALFVAHARTDVPALLAEIHRLRAQVDAAYAYAKQMGDYCSPHDVASRYADELRAALDNAKEA